MTGTGGAYTCPDCGNAVVWSGIDTGCSHKECVKLQRLRTRCAELERENAKLKKAVERAIDTLDKRARGCHVKDVVAELCNALLRLKEKEGKLG